MRNFIGKFDGDASGHAVQGPNESAVVCFVLVFQHNIGRMEDLKLSVNRLGFFFFFFLFPSSRGTISSFGVLYIRWFFFFLNYFHREYSLSFPPGEIYFFVSLEFFHVEVDRAYSFWGRRGGVDVLSVYSWILGEIWEVRLIGKSTNGRWGWLERRTVSEIPFVWDLIRHT